MKTKALLALLLICSCIWFSCHKPYHPRPCDIKPEDTGRCGTTDGYPQPNPDCNGVGCTHNFASVPLEIVDNNGNPVVLDNFYTQDKNGNKLNPDLYSYEPFTASYTVINDGWVVGHQKTFVKLSFVGFKNGIKVVDEPFEINTDCCHIAKASGRDRIIIP